MKIGFFKITLINLIIGILLYIFLFIIYPTNSNYFECNQLFEDNLFNSQITYSIPVSCDQELYLIGVNDFQSIYKFDYNYQSRPLYIFIVKIFYDILNTLLSNILMVKFLSFSLTHLLIISFSTKIFFDSLDKVKILIDEKVKILIILFVFLSPIIKWGFFDSSHQTLTLLQFVISFYFLVSEIEDFNKIYLFSFILGFLALSNLTFVLPLIFLVFNKINTEEKVFNNFFKLILTFFLFMIPILSWNLFIISQGYVPYNAATTYWNQFIWLKDYIFVRYENINFNPEYSEFYCMSVPLFLKCYFLDFLNSVFYLLNLVVLLIGTYKYIDQGKKELYTSLFKKLLTIFIISFIFWSFIGWYPPLRFNLYSIGYFLTFCFCIQFIFINNDKIKTLSAFTYILYFLFLNHWNFDEVIKFNTGLLISIFLTLYISLDYVYKNTLRRLNNSQ